MIKLVTLVLFIMITSNAAAQNFYVDATGGSDSNDGQSPSSAWKTLDKLNSSYFQPGDQIHLKCGETWREQLIVPSSGTAGIPLTFTSYGSNCSAANYPLISASDPLTGWALYSGDTYVTDINLRSSPINLIMNNSFDVNVLQWRAWPDYGNPDDALKSFIPGCSLNPGGSGAGCLKFTSSPSLAGSHLQSSPFELISGETYSLSFSLAADEQIQVNVSVMQAPYGGDDVAYQQSILAGTSLTAYNDTFIPAKDMTDTRLFFYPPVGLKVIYVDDVMVKSIAGPPSMPVQLFVDGSYVKPAQHPNSGYFTIDQDSAGNDYLVDSALSLLTHQQQDDLTGAGIHIRSINWSIEDRTISAYDGTTNTLSWTNTTNYPIVKDFGYYLDSKLWMLDLPGEWYYEAASGKLYVWLSDSSDPSTHLVEASHQERGAAMISRSDVVIENLRIRQAARQGIEISDSPGFLIRNVDISDSGSDGVYVDASPSGTIENSDITDSVNQGIYLYGSDGVSIIGNRTENTGTVGSPKNSFAAIVAGRYSEGAIVRGNTVLNSGYNGITFSYGAVVENNVIERSCLVLNDCGGIYSWNGNVPSTPYNSIVSGNIVIDSLGNIEGTPYTSFISTGIYLDDYSNHIQAADNTVIHSTYSGINLHNASNIDLANNTLYGNDRHQLTLNETGAYSGSGVMHDNVISGNTFFPIRTEESVGLYGDFGNVYLGDFANNLYSTLYWDKVVMEKLRNDPSVNNSYSLSAWQQNNQGAGSTEFIPFSIVNHRVLSYDPVNALSNGTFDSGTSSWSRWSTTGNATHTHIPDCGLNGGCVLFSTDVNSQMNHLYQYPFTLLQDQWYELRFKMRADQTTQNIQVIVWENGSWTDLGLDYREIEALQEWQLYRFTFLASGSSLARFDFILKYTGADLYIDDISIKEITVQFNEPESAAYDGPGDDSHILLNKTGMAGAVNCPDDDNNLVPKCGEYIDLSGTPVSWPVTLPAYGSEIIVWNNNPFQDRDGDGILDDGGSGIVGDNPCIGGNTDLCDDNCQLAANSLQRDADSDGVGDQCDDDDNDGMPYTYESKYTFLNPGDPSDAALDFDNDGLTNLEEYLAGTYPENSDYDGDTVSDGADTCPLDPPVKISGAAQYFSTLQGAYGNALNLDVIRSQAGTLSESLTFSENKTIAIQGGYDCMHGSKTGTTTLTGDMTINHGIITIADFSLQ